MGRIGGRCKSAGGLGKVNAGWSGTATVAAVLHADARHMELSDLRCGAGCRRLAGPICFGRARPPLLAALCYTRAVHTRAIEAAAD